MRTAGGPGLFMLAALFLAGCHRDSGTIPGSEPPDAPQFSAKKGMRLPDVTRRALGLELVDVTERPIAATLSLPVRVFHPGATSALASGMATPVQAGSCKPGQPVRVRTADGASFDGRITGLNEQLRKATGLVEVIVEIQGRPEELAAAPFLDALVTFDPGARVVAIPADALLTCSEGDFVYTTSGDYLVRTAVKTGRKNREFVEIADGLYAGDQVVSKPVLALWLVELAAVKGGQACCGETPGGK